MVIHNFFQGGKRKGEGETVMNVYEIILLVLNKQIQLTTYDDYIKQAALVPKQSTLKKNQFISVAH